MILKKAGPQLIGKVSLIGTKVIVIVNYGDVTAEQKREFMMSNPAFASMDAVQNDRFITLEYVEATPTRNIQAVQTLAKGSGLNKSTSEQSDLSAQTSLQ